MADPHDDDTSPWPPQPEEAPATSPGSVAPPVAPADATARPEVTSTTAGADARPDTLIDAGRLGRGFDPRTRRARTRRAGTRADRLDDPPGAGQPVERTRTGGWDGARVAGIILVLVGVFLLLRRFVPLDSALLLPVVAIVIGGALILGALRPRRRND